ncbi:GWxTD domain-containing protein [bacterium]|nr:GWxTD domain-containing protein [bacterium]
MAERGIQKIPSTSIVALLFLLLSAAYSEPVFEVTRFAQDSLVRVEINYSVRYNDLQFVRGNSAYLSIFRVGALLEKKEQIVTSISIYDTLIVADYSITNSTNQHFGNIDLLAPPGDYSIEIFLEDKYAKKRYSKKKKIRLPDYKKGESQLSDILFFKSVAGTLYPLLTPDIDPTDTGNYIYFECYPKEKTDSILLDICISHRGTGKDCEKKSFPTSEVIRVYHPLAFSTFSSGKYSISVRKGGEEASRELYIYLDPEKELLFDTKAAVSKLSLIASSTELDSIRNAKTDEEKLSIWENFWKRRDPSPGTAENEAKDEYYRRIRWANEHLSGLLPGWTSDRGQIYILYGEPDEIEVHPFELNSKPYEIWYYYQLDKEFIFVDKTGFGDYILYYEK